MFKGENLQSGQSWN